MTLSKTFVNNKIYAMQGYLKELDDFLLSKYSNDEIKNDAARMHIAERLFQLITDAALDINQHLIRELNLKVSDDLQGTFYILSDNKILSEDFAKKIAPSVGQRNIIVHGYDKLDKDLFMRNLRNGYIDFHKYIEFINEYLEKSEDEE